MLWRVAANGSPTLQATHPFLLVDALRGLFDARVTAALGLQECVLHLMSPA